MPAYVKSRISICSPNLAFDQNYAQMFGSGSRLWGNASPIVAFQTESYSKQLRVLVRE